MDAIKTIQRNYGDAYTIYRMLRFCSALFFTMVFTVNSLYYVTVAHLSPLELVLVGTSLEIAVFLFEIPTGVLADVKSRRLSIIIGYFLIGAGFVLEGVVPLFWAIAFAQILWGLGYTFTSGATQAWIVDEIGEEKAGKAFIEGAQAGQLGGFLGILVGVILGLVNVNIPIVSGGILMILLAVSLRFWMPEHGFQPTHTENRTTWSSMGKTLQDARYLLGRQRILIFLLGIGFFYGLYSEGFDRLWTAHLLQNITLPGLNIDSTVIIFGVIGLVSKGFSLFATEVVRRRVDTTRSESVVRSLQVSAVGIILALLVFAWTKNLWVALLCFWLIGALREITEPLLSTWMNQCIDNPQVRATLFSISSQVDAIGQIGGGPIVGLVGNLVSIRAALVASAVILSPVVPFYTLVKKKDKKPGLSMESSNTN